MKTFKFVDAKEKETFINGLRGFLRKNNGQENLYNYFADIGLNFDAESITKIEQLMNVLPTIKTGNVAEVNKLFKEYYGIKEDFFIHEINDIFLARALKHNEVIYDEKFAKHLLNMFGEVITEANGKPVIISVKQLKDVLKTSQKRGHDLVAMGFEHDLLSNLTQPLIQLSDEQVKSINSLFPNMRLYNVDPIILEKANQASKVQKIANEKVTNKLLAKYDALLNLWKTNVTTILPGFHIRNKFSNSFQMYLAFGVEALDPTMNKNAFDVIRQIAKGEELKINTKIITDSGKEINYRDAWDMAMRYEVVDRGIFAKDVPYEKGKSQLPKVISNKINPKIDPTDIKNFLPYKLGRKVGTYTENFDRFVFFTIGLKHGMTPGEAADYVKHFLFDYSDLTDFEVNVMKRIIPFYTWIRKNVPLQVENMINHPEKYRPFAKLESAIEGTVDPDEKADERYRVNYAKDWIQLPFKTRNQWGKEEAVFWNTNLPYNDINRADLPSIASMTSPFIRVPVELATNRSFFFETNIDNNKEVDAPTYIPGDLKISQKMKYFLGQIPPLKIADSLLSKEDSNLGMYIANSVLGIKISAYDYQTYKDQLMKGNSEEEEE